MHTVYIQSVVVDRFGDWQYEWTETVTAANKAAAMRKAWQVVRDCSGVTRTETETIGSATWLRLF